MTGNYPIAISPYYTDPQYLGGFRLQVKVNGAAVPVTPYLDGGVVQGIVSKADTTPAAGQPVELKTGDALAMRVRVAADALGAYSVAGVPLGPLTVTALEPSAKTALVSASAQLTTMGETLYADLALPKRTTVDLQVAIMAPLSVPAQMNVTVKDALGTRVEGPFTFVAGSTVSAMRGVIVFGDQATISAVHPSNTNATTSAVVQGEHGATVPLTLTLAFTGIQGTVYSSDGVAVASAYVRAQVVSTRRGLGAMYTNAAGLYSFAGVPVGEEILVQAQDSRNSVMVGARTTLQLNQANVLDVRYPGVGRVAGRITTVGGQPVAGVTVRANYVYDEFYGYTTYRSATSAADGRYSITDVPVGLPLDVQASLGTSFGTVTSSAQLALQTAGQNAALDLALPLSTASVLVRLVDADGVPVSASLCYNVRIDVATGQYATRSVCGPETVFANVPPGAGRATPTMAPLTLPGAANFNAVDTEQAVVVLRASVVKGTVRFADGTPVPNPSVSLVTSSNATLFAYNTGNLGEYRIIGVPTGAVTLKAEHGASALRVTAAGTLVSLDSALTRDLTLPPSAGVNGVFRDRNGNPIAGADVYVRSSTVDVDRYVKTDANGAFGFLKVAQGNITVVARDPATRLIAAGEGVLAAADQRIDLTLPESTQVSGTVTNDGLAVGSAAVTLSTTRTFGAFGPATITGTTDAEGRYSFGAASVGQLRATATVGGLVASALGTAVAGTPLTLDLQVGGAVTLTYILHGADTSRYDVNCAGGLGDGGFTGHGDAYDGAYNLTVGATGFPCGTTAELKNGARELLLGPNLISKLNVTRRILVPVAGKYARYLETFTNPTTSPVTAVVLVISNLGSDGGTRMPVTPASTGGRYAVTTDSGSDPALGHVFGSAGAELNATSSFNTPGDNAQYSWTVTLAPGASMSLLHFAIQRAPLDVNAVTQQAEALSNMTEADMFLGLSADDKSKIKNFKVNP